MSYTSFNTESFVFWTSIGFIIVATCIFYTILGEVNGRLPSNEQISTWVVNDKVFFILRKHAEFYPDSNKRGQFVIMSVLGLGLALGTWFYTRN
jgi:hypothetical protein